MRDQHGGFSETRSRITGRGSLAGGLFWPILATLALAVGCGDEPLLPVPVELESLALEPADTTVGVAGWVNLEWVAVDPNGRRLAERRVDWGVSDTSVVRLEDWSGNGSPYNRAHVTGVRPGTATVTTSWQGTSATAVIEVTDEIEMYQVASVQLVPSSVRLIALRDTLRLTVDAPELGRSLPAALFQWSSDDESVASVSASGLVTAVGNGTAAVSAAAHERAQASVVVTVTQVARTLGVLPSVDTLRAVGDTLRLALTFVDTNGHMVPGPGVDAEWSSSDHAVAVVDRAGLVTAVSEGVVEISATSVDQGLTSTAALVIDVLSERDVLVSLYDATQGPSWRDPQNWLSDAPLDTWRGVQTNTDGQVTSLDLSGRWLVGSIPPGLGYLPELRTLDLGNNRLVGAIPPQLGRLANLKSLDLGNNLLVGAIPPQLGELTDLTSLNLSGNRLTGPIPAQLGALANLEELHLFNNALETIPAELGKLSNLRTFDLAYNTLTGSIPPQFFALTELRELSLEDNQLTGSVPPELGRLAKLEVLNLGRNRLTGEIPRELGDLANLRTLIFDSFLGGNQLSGSIPPELGRLSNLRRLGLANNLLTGEIPPELAHLTNLEVLYLHFNGLTGPLPAWLGDLSRLRRLRLSANRLSGPIPPELGELSELTHLYLWANRLEGPVPAELANLTNLEELLLTGNPQLAGPLPPVLGTLPRLGSLTVAQTGLSGPIPLQFVNLGLGRFEWSDSKLCAPLDRVFQEWLETIPTLAAGPSCLADALAALYEAAGGSGWRNAGSWLTDAPVSEWHGVSADEDGRLTALDLRGNGLSGTVPPEIGTLRDLTRLDVRDNALEGELPAELGELGELRWLYLSGNRFEGRPPAELGSLAELSALHLAHNQFTSALPGSFTRLSKMADFQWNESGLCASPAVWFQEWLGMIANHAGGPNCSSPLRLSVPAAHVNQAAQNLEGTVSLIAGRTGLLRVFATADQANDRRLAARATFFVNGRETHRAEMELGSERGIPEDAVSGEPDQYFRARIPGDILVPGVEMVVEVDPDRVVPRAPGSVVRYPPRGRAALEVRQMPRWGLTVVPVMGTQDPASTVLDWVAGMGPGHTAVEYVTHVLPVGDYSVNVRDPFIRTGTGLEEIEDWYFLHTEIGLLRALEGGTGTYYGVVSGQSVGIQGVGGGSVGVGRTGLHTMAHELGHTMRLGHSPCGIAFDDDPLYPYPDGSIGVWGYDARGDTLVSPATTDVMGNCSGWAWISDYYFHQALKDRLRTASGEPPTTAPENLAGRGQHLLLWGGASPDGELRLDPAFVLDMPGQLPSRPGPYRLEGFGNDGQLDFSVHFAMDELSQGGGSFLLTIPVGDDWSVPLERVVLTGPEGTVELNPDSRDPVALVVDRRTGRLRSVLRGEDATGAMTAVTADARGASRAGSETHVLISNGLPRRMPN